MKATSFRPGDALHFLVAVVMLIWLAVQSWVSDQLQGEVLSLQKQNFVLANQLSIFRQEAESMQQSCMIVAEEVTMHLAVNYGKHLRKTCEGEQ